MNGTSYPRSRHSSNSAKGILHVKSPRYGTQSITQSTSSTRRKGDSKRDTLTGFQQLAGMQQPMITILATGFVFFCCFFLNHRLENHKSLIVYATLEEVLCTERHITPQNCAKSFSDRG